MLISAANMNPMKKRPSFMRALLLNNPPEEVRCSSSICFSDNPKLHSTVAAICGKETCATHHRIIVGLSIFFAYIAPITLKYEVEGQETANLGRGI